jgi:hypothetical protein
VIRLLRGAQVAWNTGIWRQSPARLYKLLRHRREFSRVNKALFYHRFATALFVAVELGVFKQLLVSGQSSAELAERCGAHPEAVRTLLRILESQDWVHRSGEQVELTEFARDFFAADGPMSARYMLELMGTQAKAFPQVLESMRTGRCPEALDVRQLDGSYPAFLTAVNNYLYWAGRELLHKTELPEVNRFIVGSMGVSFSALLLEHRPQARVTYGCLEHLVREIPRLRTEFGVDPGRVEATHAHSGEPGDDDWGSQSYDLVFLTRKMILEPAEGVGEKFARKAFDVLSPGGVAVFWETVYSESEPMPLGRAMEAVFDLCTSPAAPARSADDYRRLFLGIGYASVEVVPCLGGQTTFLIARK